MLCRLSFYYNLFLRSNRLQKNPTICKLFYLNLTDLKSYKGICDHMMFSGTCLPYIFAYPSDYNLLNCKYFYKSTNFVKQIIKWYSSDNKFGNSIPGKTKARVSKAKQKLEQTKLKVREAKERVKDIKENVLTIPNVLCLTRIGLSPVLSYLILQESYSTSLLVFGFAGVTDLLDGLIARNFKSQQSVFGSFLDPVADKFLVTTLFVTLSVMDLIPVILTSLIIVRDLCLLSAGFYVRYQSLPPPKTLSRYFDVTYATANLYPTFISKVNTAIQLSLIALTLAAPVFNYVNHQFLVALWFMTGGTTVLSGLSYIFAKNTVKFLKQRKKA